MFAIGMATTLCIAASFGQNFEAEGRCLIINGSRAANVRLASQAKSMIAILKKNPNANAVSVQHSKRSSRLAVNGALLIKLSGADAAAAGTSIRGLAVALSTRINAALALPDLVVTPESLKLPVGKPGILRVIGKKAHLAKLFGEGLNIRQVSEGFEVRASTPIKLDANLVGGKSSKKIPISVLPLAASLPQTLLAEVVGFPAASSATRSSVLAAIQRKLVVSAQSKISIGTFEAAPVASGKAKAFTVPIEVTAPNAFPSRGSVVVNVKNIGELRTRETELWYCNHPEEVKSEQPLYRGVLETDQPVRLLYHHYNATKFPLGITVSLVNRSSEPARVIVLPGEGEPNKDPVRTGLGAGAEFLRNWESGSGEVILVPPKSELPIAARLLHPHQTASGIVYVRLLGDKASKIGMHVDALAAGKIPASWTEYRGGNAWNFAAPKTLTNFEEVPVNAVEHVYPRPFMELAARYEVGGRFAFIRLGQAPITNASETRQLDGNFGVIYTVDLALENRTSKPAKVEVVFETSAGYSAAVFWIDGKFVATPVLQEKDEFNLRTETLSPGQSKRIRLRTMPLSGSSYPATITVRPVDR